MTLQNFKQEQQGLENADAAPENEDVVEEVVGSGGGVQVPTTNLEEINIFQPT